LKERRIWTGKEDVFPAIASCAAACKNTLEADDLMTDDSEPLSPLRIINAVVEESKRTSDSSKEYQRRALAATGQLLETFCPPLDIFQELYPYIKSLIQDISDASSEGNSFVSQQQDPKKRALEEKEAALNKARNKLVQAECLRILGAAWPIQFATQEKFLMDVLDLFVSELKLANWNSRVKILESVQKFVQRIYIPTLPSDKGHSLLTNNVIETLLFAVGPSVNDPKFHVVRETALKTIKEIILKLKDSSEDTSSFKSYIQELLKGRENDTQTKLQVLEISALLKTL